MTSISGVMMPLRAYRICVTQRPRRGLRCRSKRNSASFGSVSRLRPYSEDGPSRTSESPRSEEHTSELQSLAYLVCRLLLEKKKKKQITSVEHCRRTSGAE